jgi:hypothetical protein
MEREVISIKRKALRINLDESVYGTFAEIGAGQEVARTFFQVGGASGTIAKTMSAYDMAYSDAIYGEEKSGRYVSESRLMKMLDHECQLLETRLVDQKYQNRRFFAFADTCSILNFKKTNDPHSWLGLRFQLTPKGGYNDAIIHVRLKDNDALLQQKVIGGIGVNLIFACYWYANDLNKFVDSLMDNLSTDQVEIDLLRIEGPDFDIDNRLLALKLVKKGFTEATIFGSNREVHQPKDFLYKKNVLCLRSRFRPFTKLSENMLESGKKTFEGIMGAEKKYITLSELTLNNLNEDDSNPSDFIDRAELLCSLGHTVLLSNCDKHDKLVSFLNRCRTNKVGIIVGVMNLNSMLNIASYENQASELLHYFGNVFKGNTHMLAYPYFSKKEKKVIEAESLKVKAEVKHLYKHLLESKLISGIKNYDKKLLDIHADDVIELILSNDKRWKKFVPAKAAITIEKKGLFNIGKGKAK